MTRRPTAAYNEKMVALLAAAVLAAAPPPAHVEVGAARLRLAQSSYCWTTVCADYIAPKCGDGRTPAIRVRRNQTIRFRLGFTPKQLSLGFYATVGVAMTHQPLKPATVSRYRVTRGGAFAIFARTARGFDSSYVGCLRLR